jgi:hypothetical protein
MDIDIQKLSDDKIRIHISEVRARMLELISLLAKRAIAHDASKLQSPESEGFASLYERFAKAEYGTPEYLECCKLIQPILDHHYSLNSHHPQHFS